MVERNGQHGWGFWRGGATAGVLAMANIWAVGCGGSSVKHTGSDPGGASGSSGTTAGTGGSAGSMVLAGRGGASRGGSGGASGAVGGSTTGGTGGRGGSGGTGRGGAGAGGAGSGGDASGGTAGMCPPIECEAVACPDGVLVQEGCSCPVCRCNEVACATSDCADGQQPFLPPGACCPVCPDPAIDSCDNDDDCVMATSLLECCGCPVAMSRNHYDEDLCYWIRDEPRDIPDECIIPCPAIVCAPCAEPAVFCVGGACTALAIR